MIQISRYLETTVQCLIWLAMCLAWTGCSQDHQKAAVPPGPVKVITAKPAVLATISDKDEQAMASVSSGHGSVQKILFSEQGHSVAYTIEKDGLFRVVYKEATGKPYKEIQWTTLSPDGGRIAYSAMLGDTWRMVVDGKEEATYDEVGMAKFSSDGRHVLYDARKGSSWMMVIDGRVAGECPQNCQYFDKFFSSDAEKIISIESPVETGGVFRVLVSTLAYRTLETKAIPGYASEIVYNEEKTRLAMVNDHGGKKRVIELDLDRLAAIKEGPIYDDIIHPTFGEDGVSVAYVGAKETKRYLVLNGRDELITEGVLRERPVIRPDSTGAGIIIDDEKNGAFLHEAFIRTKTKKKAYQEAASIIYNKRDNRHAYIAHQGKGNIFMVVNGKEGPAFDMIVTPQFSPDGRFLVYRARKDGKRFVVVADDSGKVLSQHQAYEQVFQPVFSADGKSIAYGVKEGKVLSWKVVAL